MYRDPRDQLRAMYGPGGLSDLAGALSGLGDAPVLNVQFSAALARNSLTQSQGVVARVLAAQAANPPLDSPPPGIDVNARCDCLVDGIHQTFNEVGPGQLAQLRAACQQNVTDFEAALRMQASSEGVAIPACDGTGGGATPWYKQPKYIVPGALGIGLLGLLVWKMT